MLVLFQLRRPVHHRWCIEISLVNQVQATRHDVVKFKERILRPDFLGGSLFPRDFWRLPTDGKTAVLAIR